MSRPIFAFDFSMNKPAMCCFINDEAKFFIWPLNIDKISYQKLNDCGVIIHNRNLEPVKDNTMNEHSLIYNHVSRAAALADLIINVIENLVYNNGYDKKDVIIANEGFSFSSKGDATLDLSGYKYVLMYKLMEKGYTDFKTYAPITIKSIAGCAKRGMGKTEMIESASKLYQGINEKGTFLRTLALEPEKLKKKTAFVQCVDDLCDAFWCMRTVLAKEK